MNLFHRAVNLAVYELMGDAGMVNQQVEKYLSVTPEKLREQADEILSDDNCSILYYLSKN